MFNKFSYYLLKCTYLHKYIKLFRIYNELQVVLISIVVLKKTSHQEYIINKLTYRSICNHIQ